MLTERIEPKLERIRHDITEIAKFISPSAPGSTRISFSREDREARQYVRAAMEAAGLSVRVDAAANMIGTREVATGLPSILVGSHIDTVEGGGMFDGIAGVASGLEAARRLKELGMELAHPLEIVVFLAEEPSPFVISTIGSRAMAGTLSSEKMALEDKSGRKLGDAITELGGDPARLRDAARSPGDLAGYLELHIEQGPRLFSHGVPVGVVTGIAGIRRGTVRVTGRADHAGTTPMDSRKDALAAASEVVLALEAICAQSGAVVGTTGRIEAYPNALNVVPGSVTLGMEMRGLEEKRLDEAAAAFGAEIRRIGEKRNITIGFDMGVSSRSIHFPEELVRLAEGACERLAIPYMSLPSWAGHDANHLAEIAPAIMLFVPSKDGRSHCPEEWTDFEDIRLGTEVLARAIIDIDRRRS